MLDKSQHYAATGGIPDALLSCRPVQSNLAIYIEAVSIAVRGGMATPVGETGSKVRFARHSGVVRIASDKPTFH